MIGMGHLNNVSFDQWQVEAGRYAIIKKAGVPHTTLLVIEIFLVESPSEPLRGATLHLPLDIAGMQRLADVLGYAGSQDLNFAGLRIKFEIHQTAGKSWRAHRSSMHGATADYRTSGLPEPWP